MIEQKSTQPGMEPQRIAIDHVEWPSLRAAVDYFMQDLRNL